MTNDTTMMHAALRLAEAGAHVFPCVENAKRPATKHGLADATRDADQIRAWWSRRPDLNVAVATGASGLAVVDLDPPDGIASWDALAAEHDEQTPPLRVRTPRGGWHLYFRADPDRPLRSTAGQLASHVDTRGRGGYVLAPPSRVDGKRYEWQTDVLGYLRLALPTIPAWVLDALAPPAPSVAPRAPIVLRPGNSTRYAEKALQGEVQAVLDAVTGTRNRTLNVAAVKLGSLVGAGRLDGELAREALTAAGLAAGLTAREVQATIHSGLTHGVDNPRTLGGAA